MMTERINELLRSSLANIISREIYLNGGLITITKVDTSPDLKHSKIYISILPENLTGTALQKLRKNNALFSKKIAKTTRLRKVPKFKWLLDEGERRIVEVSKIMDDVNY